MISIIFTALAFYTIFTKRLSLSPSSEIRRPKTYYWAAITLGFVAVSEILGRSFDSFSTFAYMVTIIVPIITIFMLKERKLENIVIPELTNWKKTENNIAWVILIGAALFFVGLYIYDLVKI